MDTRPRAGYVSVLRLDRMKRGRMPARLACVAVVAAVAALPAAAASQTFVDPTGDAGSGGMDVTTVAVQGDPGGQVSVRVTVPNRTSLQTTDAFQLYLDTDKNPSTGTVGMEYRLRAFGGGDMGLDRWDGTQWAPVAAGSYSFSGGFSATVPTSALGNTRGFNFWIATLANGVLSDRAPDGGTWTMDLDVTPPADSDGDGIVDPSDACPTVPRGRYDTNANGCPGPFRTINAEVRPVAAIVASIVRLVQLRIENLPPGAVVTVRSGSVRERIAARRTTAVSRRLLKRPMRPGTVVVVTATKSGWVGYHGTFVVRTSFPVLRLTARRCIPVGSTAPVRCTARLRGS